MRSLKIMRKTHIHIDTGDSGLLALITVGKHDRIADVLDADFVYIEVSGIPLVLNILQTYLLLPIL